MKIFSNIITLCGLILCKKSRSAVNLRDKNFSLNNLPYRFVFFITASFALLSYQIFLSKNNEENDRRQDIRIWSGDFYTSYE